MNTELKIKLNKDGAVVKVEALHDGEWIDITNHIGAQDGTDKYIIVNLGKKYNLFLNETDISGE